MAKALSIDLRHRVVAAIAEGMSRRQAAARFGVSAASAVRWHQRFKASGTVAPSRQGGDRRSGRIEAYSEVILGLVTETPDMTLAELRTKLKERRVSAGIGTLWRFFKRRGTVGIFVCEAVFRHASTKRSLNMTANCVFASNHSRGGRFQSAAAWFKTRYSSFAAASSDGKWPLVLTARRSFEFSASIAFVV